jgi:hypothetical protein
MSSSNRLFFVSSEAFERLAQSPLGGFVKISACTEPTNRKKNGTLGPVDILQAEFKKMSITLIEKKKIFFLIYKEIQNGSGAK